MKTFLMIGAACASVMAMPAFAQTVNGTINITGTVGSKCAVVSPTPGSTFTDNVNLGELAQANGTLESSATLSGRFISTTTSATPALRVVCNSANPRVAVDATELTTGGTAGAGYANRVDYTARVNVTTTSGVVTVANATTGAATAATALGAPITAAAGNNVTVTADTFTTPTAGAVLVAGNYTGQIVFTIAPN